ncbi:MAG: 30S ribosomal protein S8 [Chlamydiae bacterium]|jgi:small subunit ribosomal protein S8|nr:30S ribosomal protein S8 [Chlamydiota bacterium]
MSLSDPIADLLTRIRNAAQAKNRYVDVNFSKMKRSIVEIMKEAGFVENYLVNEEQRKMRIFLRYNKQRESVIHDLKRESKPGIRKYVGYQEIPNIMLGLGLSIVSTPKGVISGYEAKKAKVGGELICTIW